MSVDPFIHEGSQGINPYSYILNNPLAGTDPTGYKPQGFTQNWKSVSVNEVKFKGSKSNGGPIGGSTGGISGPTGISTFVGLFSSGRTMDIGSYNTQGGTTDGNADPEEDSENESDATSLKLNRLNEQIDSTMKELAEASDYSITLVAHLDESLNFKGYEIFDFIGHAFVILRGPSGDISAGYWPQSASFEDFAKDTPILGLVSSDVDYYERFNGWLKTGIDPKGLGGQFAYRKYALTKSQYDKGISAISSWNQNPYKGRSRMCGTFAKHVLNETGQSFGSSTTPFYLFYEMGGSFEKK